MQTKQILDLVMAALDDMKGRDIVVLDVRGKTTVTDYLVIASGTSERHVRSLAGHIVQQAKAVGLPPLGIEGERVSDWVVVDLGDVVAHVMMPQTRDFYNLEKLWSVAPVPAELSVG